MLSANTISSANNPIMTTQKTWYKFMISPNNTDYLRNLVKARVGWVEGRNPANILFVVP
ncbi:hypothetical protein THII_1677 [Thioploca ingrica]|uniref:Uncharacterized protein n=1 Tax=Thioploca ingrica TaxID=40754 RepID=A0A090AFV8_9GAMM|nr:hypothetical protein THII_1677 [Thioploca ingrica]